MYSQWYTTTGTDFSWQGMRLSGEANAQQQIRYSITNNICSYDALLKNLMIILILITL